MTTCEVEVERRGGIDEGRDPAGIEATGSGRDEWDPSKAEKENFSVKCGNAANLNLNLSENLSPRRKRRMMEEMTQSQCRLSNRQGPRNGQQEEKLNGLPSVVVVLQIQ